MGERPSEPNAPQSELSPSERLESWKEIAAYLKRDVRTVQRWEKGEGLPVHRHLHEKLGTVYTYKSELDAWWNNRQPRLEAEEARGKEARKLWRWWLAVAAVAVVVAAGVGMWLAQHPALPFEERDWVLIARFDNHTGEALFDGTLEYSLERELSNSRFVNVVPRERINDALRLMRKPLDTTIDSAVAREVALRDGGIRALLTGRVEKLDSTYVLSAALMNPSEGITVASFSEDAQGQQNVVLAVRRLSNRLRETLGEKLALIQENEQKLEKVTTPSLRALQLYSQAVALINPVVPEPKWGIAAELLQQAVAADPDFASARIWLAHCLSNVGKGDEAAPHWQRAFRLADSTTDRERYFILGSYYWRYLEDNDKAARAFEVLVQLYPDHFWGTFKLAEIYRQQGRFEEALPYVARTVEFRPNHWRSHWRAAIFYQRLGRIEEAIPYLGRAAELHPSDFRTNSQAAKAFAVWDSNPARAKAYVERARLLAASGEPKRGGAWQWIELFPAREHMLAGDMVQAIDEVTGVAQTISSRSASEQEALAIAVGSMYLTVGKLRAAEETFQKARDANYRLSWVAFARDDEDAFRKHLSTARPRRASSVLLVRAGLLSQAEEMLTTLEKQGARTEDLLAVRGELALARGRKAEAIPLLQEALKRLRIKGEPTYFLAVESLARLWEEQGELQRAIQVLQEASQENTRAIMYGGSSAFSWMRTQMRLAQLYRKVGREEEAQKIEAELLKLLAYADPDHPLLQQLKRAQDLALAQSSK